MERDFIRDPNMMPIPPTRLKKKYSPPNPCMSATARKKKAPPPPPPRKDQEYYRFRASPIPKSPTKGDFLPSFVPPIVSQSGPLIEECSLPTVSSPQASVPPCKICPEDNPEEFIDQEFASALQEMSFEDEEPQSLESKRSSITHSLERSTSPLVSNDKYRISTYASESRLEDPPTSNVISKVRLFESQGVFASTQSMPKSKTVSFPINNPKSRGFQVKDRERISRVKKRMPIDLNCESKAREDAPHLSEKPRISRVDSPRIESAKCALVKDIKRITEGEVFHGLKPARPSTLLSPREIRCKPISTTKLPTSEEEHWVKGIVANKTFKSLKSSMSSPEMTQELAGLSQANNAEAQVSLSSEKVVVFELTPGMLSKDIYDKNYSVCEIINAPALPFREEAKKPLERGKSYYQDTEHNPQIVVSFEEEQFSALSSPSSETNLKELESAVRSQSIPSLSPKKKDRSQRETGHWNDFLKGIGHLSFDFEDSNTSGEIFM